MEAKGYRVIDETDGKTGSGPHLHVQLPPQWKGGSGSSPAQKPSAPDAKSPASTADVGPAKKVPTEEEAAAAKAAADAKAVHADERKQAGLGKRPKERSRMMASVEEAKDDYEEADDKLQLFDARMRKRHGLSTTTGMTALTGDEADFRERLVAARGRAQEIVDDRGRDLKQAEGNAGEAARKKASQQTTAELEKEFGNPETEYVLPSKAKPRAAK
jgi:hypothetical protein